WTVKIVMITFIGSVAFLPAMFHHMFPTYLLKRILYGFGALISLYSLYIALAPISMFLVIAESLAIAIAGSASISIFILWKVIRDKKAGAIFLFIASLFFGINVVWSSIPNILRLEFIH